MGFSFCTDLLPNTLYRKCIKFVPVNPIPDHVVFGKQIVFVELQLTGCNKRTKVPIIWCIFNEIHENYIFY